MNGIDFDIAHLLAGSLVLVSLLELYQDRLYALLNIYALHAVVLAASVAWQALIQDAPHLYVTAAIALIFKAMVIPVALHRIIVRLGIHREIEKVVGVGLTMLAGMALVALAMVVMLRVTQEADPLAREDLAFALSVVLLGLLMMVTRRNAVSQVVGFMSLENGLVLAATGAKGMPLVVEISVAFSILIAFIVIGIFLFRIRERFDTVDVQIISDFRGERQSRLMRSPAYWEFRLLRRRCSPPCQTTAWPPVRILPRRGSPCSAQCHCFSSSRSLALTYWSTISTARLSF